MNLERMRQAAIEASKDNDKWAILCTDGDYQLARTDDEAIALLKDTVDATEYLSGEAKHNYALVRVDL